MPRKKKVTSAQADLAQAMKDMEALKSKLPELEKAAEKERAEEELVAREAEAHKRALADELSWLFDKKILPEDQAAPYKDKKGTFNPYRTLRVSKG